MFKNLFRYVKILFVISFIIFEEVVWDRIGKPAYNAVKSLKIMDRFDTWLSNVEHRYILLGIFLTPFIGMEVASILAVKALATGALITGLGLYSIKILLTAPVVIIFKAGKEELVSFWVIRYSYGCILTLKRSKTFRYVKNYIKEFKKELVIFRENYLDGDGKFKEELARIYKNLKNIEA